MPEVAVKKAAPVTRIEAPKVIEKPITPKPRVVPVAKPVEPKAIAKPKVIPATKKAKTAKLPPKLESTQRLLLFHCQHYVRLRLLPWPGLDLLVFL